PARWRPGPRGLGRVARAQPDRARGLSQDGMPRGRGRRGRHRSSPDVALKTGDRSRLQGTAGEDLADLTLEQLLQAARDGDGVSVSVVRDTIKYLGMAAANLVAIADPQTLVLGGIMASAADLLLEPVRTEVQRRLPRAMTDDLAIVPAL